MSACRLVHGLHLLCSMNTTSIKKTLQGDCKVRTPGTNQHRWMKSTRAKVVQKRLGKNSLREITVIKIIINIHIDM